MLTPSTGGTRHITQQNAREIVGCASVKSCLFETCYPGWHRLIRFKYASNILFRNYCVQSVAAQQQNVTVLQVKLTGVYVKFTLSSGRLRKYIAHRVLGKGLRVDCNLGEQRY